jgi:cleavage stimulation factor subunit 2
MGRKLRVDFSHEGAAPDDYIPTPPPAAAAPTPMPQLPAGVDIPAGISAPDAISATLKQLQPPQLLEILGQMKTLVSQDPMKATELLRQAPQLSYAIFQALLLMNLVDTSVLTQVIEGPAAAPAPPPQAAPQYYATPTPAPQPVVAPPQPAPVQVAPQVQDPQRQQLLQSVMHLTPEQIAAFPPEQQQQIMYLKQTLLAQGGAM